jgi:ribosome maturation factor RimP
LEVSTGGGDRQVSIVERVREIVEPLLARHSLEVYDIELAGSQLRVTISRPAPSDEGLDLDTIAQATRLISLALDEHDPIEGRYTLEVSSPGLERSLRTQSHFTRAVGSLVNVKTRPGVEGERRVHGVLAGADDDGVTIEDRHLRYDEIERARTVFEWGPPAKPAKPPRKKHSREKRAS